MPIGRIVKALSGFYYVSDRDEIYQCRARGNFRKKKITPLVGDIVEYELIGATDGYVTAIQERKNALVRPPVANIDQAILVFSAKHPDFDEKCILCRRLIGFTIWVYSETKVITGHIMELNSLGASNDKSHRWPVLTIAKS